ncbi:fibronectin type III domain-containing protein [Micromonospora sp. NPDC049679]|uniref:fibronectin type III domain-containing protein n=1 Tax=Micromonospora sp. NPDC049679 TaxID=3155920 RepID=UPI0033DA787D
MTLFLTGAADTSGTVRWPDSTTSAFSVTAGEVAAVPVPTSVATMPLEGTANVGIHITAGLPITVYGLNFMNGTSDAYVALPTTTLGTRYRALAHKTTQPGYPSRLTVLATGDGTTVTVTPKNAIGGRPAGTPYTVSLNAGQVYTVASTTTAGAEADVTGALVASDKPVAVYAGVGCGNIGVGACDHIVEAMTPTKSWGTSFLLVRYAKASGGDPVRVLADQDGTEVKVDGSVVATLAAGEFYEGTLMASGGNTGALITTSKPALVAQYMTNNAYGPSGSTVTGDPSSMLVPPYQQYLDSYTLATPGSGFAFNAVNVAIPTSAIGSLTLDGEPVPAGSFAAIGSTGFSSAQLSVGLGTHNLRASAPFGAFAYGANDYNSYAYPGGAGLSPVASVARVTVNPASVTGTVGKNACLTATVTDAGNAPVAGVRVDITATGANNGATGNAITASDGTARVCYTGAQTGTDTVRVAVGTETVTATVTWANAAGRPAAPSAPGVRAGDRSVKVDWTVPASNGSTITGYTVTSAPGGLTCNATAPATTCTVGRLSNGTAYTFTVVAHSSAGDSPASAASVAVTPTATSTTPTAPATPGVRAGDRSVKVDWTVPASNGSTITGYTVTSAPGGLTCNATAPATTCTVGRLSNGTAYTFTVVAHSSAGDSPASAASVAVTPTATSTTTTLTVDDTEPVQGGTITLTARGYRTGSIVEFYLHSKPVFLGTAVADEAGVATLNASLPAGVTGSHNVVAVGTAPDGTPISRHLRITVAASSGGLARTGSDTIGYLGAGVALILVGAALYIAARKRKHMRRREV